MISLRSIERRYKAMLLKMKAQKIDLNNRFNCYICRMGHVTKTRDVDVGVTPMMHQCETCGNVAISTHYKDILKDQDPTQEWYRPTLSQLRKMRKNEAMLEHVFNGGLDVRKV